MTEAHVAVDTAIKDAERLRHSLKRSRTRQVWSKDEKSLIKANGLAWFNNYRPVIARIIDNELLHEVDAIYKSLLSSSERASSRALYDGLLKSIKTELIEIRGYTLTSSTVSMTTSDEPPDFSSLVLNPHMKSILERRWRECVRCINANAALAATVMMGGLIEGLLLARINQELEKGDIFRASKAPKDRITGKTLPLKDWTLRHYIDVAHELKWISQSAKDIGEVMRDYRNYVHPQKEFSHGVILDRKDASLFWEISKTIARQLL